MAKETTTRKKAQVITEDETPDVSALMQTISKLKSENEFLKSKLNEAAEQFKLMSVGEIYKRLDLLWKIITLRGAEEVFGRDFVEVATENFKEIMFPVEEPDKEETNV